MAIYHLRLKVLSRKLSRLWPGGVTSRSAVAAASYRSGERLFDMRQGRWFEYTKPDVVHKEIMVPDGVDVPPWFHDRQALWNAVERSEKRVDAQLYREVELSIPRELTPDQRVALVRRYVRDHYVSQGMVADIALHCPKAADGQDQPHAHVLLTTRRIDLSTETGFSAYKERDWNEREDVAKQVAEARKRYNRTGLEADKDALERANALRNVAIWRAGWAEYANEALAAAGSEARIDHRTLEKQGIFDRLPQISLGIVRHIEKTYDYLKDRLTNWVAIKKRAALFEEVKHFEKRDTGSLVDLLIHLTDMAEGFVAPFRKGKPKQQPGGSHER